MAELNKDSSNSLTWKLCVLYIKPFYSMGNQKTTENGSCGS